LPGWTTRSSPHSRAYPSGFHHCAPEPAAQQPVLVCLAQARQQTAQNRPRQEQGTYRGYSISSLRQPHVRIMCSMCGATPPPQPKPAIPLHGKSQAP
jgi:hypothetical protein